MDEFSGSFSDFRRLRFLFRIPGDDAAGEGGGPGRFDFRFPTAGDVGADNSELIVCRFPFNSQEGADVLSAFGLMVGRTGIRAGMDVPIGLCVGSTGAVVGTDATAGADVLSTTGLIVRSTGAAVGTDTTTGADVLSAIGLSVGSSGTGVGIDVVTGADVVALTGLIVRLTGSDVGKCTTTGADVDTSIGLKEGSTTGADVLSRFGDKVGTPEGDSLGMELITGHTRGTTGGSWSSFWETRRKGKMIMRKQVHNKEMNPFL